MSTGEERELEELTADDRLLDIFGAVTWEDDPQPTRPPSLPGPRPAGDDPLLALLQALRDDVEADQPAPVADVAPVIRLAGRRRAHRAGVAVAVAAAVFSVSGVAAAGFSGVSSPLYPLHKAIWGPTASQQALHRAETFANLASRHLAAGRLTAAGEALDHAESALARVDLEEQGSLPDRISALRDQLTAAYAADAARQQAADDAKAAAEQAKSQGNHGQSTDNGGSTKPGSDGRSHGKSDSPGGDKSHGDGADRSDSTDPTSQDSGDAGHGTDAGEAQGAAAHGGDSSVHHGD